MTFTKQEAAVLLGYLESLRRGEGHPIEHSTRHTILSDKDLASLENKIKDNSK